MQAEHPEATCDLNYCSGTGQSTFGRMTVRDLDEGLLVKVG